MQRAYHVGGCTIFEIGKKPSISSLHSLRYFSARAGPIGSLRYRQTTIRRHALISSIPGTSSLFSLRSTSSRNWDARRTEENKDRKNSRQWQRRPDGASQFSTSSSPSFFYRQAVRMWSVAQRHGCCGRRGTQVDDSPDGTRPDQETRDTNGVFAATAVADDHGTDGVAGTAAPGSSLTSQESRSEPPLFLDDVFRLVNAVQRHYEAAIIKKDPTHHPHPLSSPASTAAGRPTIPTLGHLVRRDGTKEGALSAYELGHYAETGWDNRLGKVAERETNHLYLHSVERAPTAYELQRASLLSLLQQLVVYGFMKGNRSCFCQQQKATAAFLLSSHLYDGWPSLAQRGAKSYLELLAHHHVRPNDQLEWKILCDRLSVPSCSQDLISRTSGGEGKKSIRGNRRGRDADKGQARGGGPGQAEATNEADGEMPEVALAVLPLLPSSMAFSPGRGGAAAVTHLRLLASTLSSGEAVAVIRWSRYFNPKQHISSVDISVVIRKILQESASRSALRSAEEAAQLQFLLRCWHSSRRAEVANPALGRACGVSHTHYHRATIEGSTLIITVDEGAGFGSYIEDDAREVVKGNTEKSKTWDFGSTKGLNEGLVLGRWSKVLQEVLRRLVSHHGRGGGLSKDQGSGGFTHTATATNNNNSNDDTDKKALLRLRFLQDDFLASSDPEAVSADLPHQASVVSQILNDVIFFMQHADLAAQSLVTQKVVIHKWQLPAVPKAALLHPSNPSDSEQVLLRNPPTRGLVIPAAAAVVRRGLALKDTRGPASSSSAAPSSPEWSGNHSSSVDAMWFPPEAVVQLRRRLWILRHLPAHIPRTLVRFDTTHGGGNNVLPVLDRSPARELLSCLLVSVYALAVSNAFGESYECTDASNAASVSPPEKVEPQRWKTLLRETRAAVTPLMFRPPHACYAALNEHCIALFTQLGNTVSATLFSQQVHWTRNHKRRGVNLDSARGFSSPRSTEVNSEESRILRRVFIESAKQFFEPPEPHFYRPHYMEESHLQQHLYYNAHRTLNENALNTWIRWKQERKQDKDQHQKHEHPEEGLASTLGVVGKEIHLVSAATRRVLISFLQSSHSTNPKTTNTSPTTVSSPGVGIDSHVAVGLETFTYLQQKASCLRNFHVSLYLETLSAVAPVQVLLQALAKEIEAFGPPVFSPESVAALLTAIVLGDTQRHGQSKGTTVADLRKEMESSSDAGNEFVQEVKCAVEPEENGVSVSSLLTASGCDDLYFCVSSDKLHAVSSYFKALFHPGFFQRIVFVHNAEEASNRSEEAKSHLTASDAVLVESGWHGVEALLIGRSLRVADQYPTTTTERFFKIHTNTGSGRNGTRRQGGDEGKEDGKSATATSQPFILAQFSPPPLRAHYYRLNVQAALQFFRAKKQRDVESWSPRIRPTSSDHPHTQEESLPFDVSPAAASAPYVVAGKLPCDMYAVYKPPGVNCTLHAHHPSLISFLQDHLPWNTADTYDSTCAITSSSSSSNAVHGGGVHGGIDPPAALQSKPDLPVVPVVHQHGLVNRVDVGTSGLVLVTTRTASLLQSCAATSVHRRVRKYYRAFVRPSQANASFFSLTTTGLWYLPPRGCISGHVFANGSDSSMFAALRNSGGAGYGSLSFLEETAPSPSPRLPVAQLDQRQAFTSFHVLRFFPKHRVYDVEVSLVSGRRHQIRQHFASIGFPLLGDERYGGPVEAVDSDDAGHRVHHVKQQHQRASFYRRFIQRPALHACRVEILPGELSTAQEESENLSDRPSGMVVVECPLPQDMKQLLAYLERHE